MCKGANTRTCPGWGRAVLCMNGSWLPRDPISASVHMAVDISARIVRVTVVFMASAATDAENAVPFRSPRCSFAANDMGSRWWFSSASRDDIIRRVPEVARPSKTLIEGFPMSVPAT